MKKKEKVKPSSKGKLKKAPRLKRNRAVELATFFRAGIMAANGNPDLTGFSANDLYVALMMLIEDVHMVLAPKDREPYLCRECIVSRCTGCFELTKKNFKPKTATASKGNSLRQSNG